MPARVAAPFGDRAALSALLVLPLLGGVALGPVSLPVTDTLSTLLAHPVRRDHPAG